MFDLPPWDTLAIGSAVQFSAGLALDWVYCKWTHAAVDHQAMACAAWSGMSGALVMGITLVLVADPWTIPASLVGRMLGSYLAVRTKRQVDA